MIETLKEIEVFVKFLYPGMILTGDGYSENGEKVIDKNIPLTQEKINELISKGIKVIRYTPEKPPLKKEISSPMISEESINKAFEVIGYLENEIKKEGEKAKISPKEINLVIQNFINDIKTNSNAFLNLLQLFNQDEYLFTHSVNVATISMLLGISLKLDEEKIAQIGISALLHDIGKYKISREIINKQEKLTEEEWNIIKKHPVISFNILKEISEFDNAIKLGILSHHENYSGGGYPLGITHEKIHPFAQIISIADVFDGATSPRPYRMPLSFDEAFNYIMENSGKKFNPAYAQVFLRDMIKRINEEPLYPVGSFVLLNTGEVAEVVGHRLSEFTLRPIVNIFLKLNPGGSPLLHRIPIQIDLEKDYNRVIVKRILDSSKIESFKKILGKHGG